MSCVYKCDRCGKIISDAEFIRVIPSEEPDHSEELSKYVTASRLALFDGSRKYDLCIECKIKLVDWLSNDEEVQNG